VMSGGGDDEVFIMPFEEVCVVVAKDFLI
jgi:hypothetical protein